MKFYKAIYYICGGKFDVRQTQSQSTAEKTSLPAAVLQRKTLNIGVYQLSWEEF